MARTITLADLIDSQSIGQIPGSFGRGQGAFKSSSGNLVNLTPQGWKDQGSGEMLTDNMGGGQQMLDYSSPMDYMGAKGYRLKGDSSKMQTADGRMIDLLPGKAKAKQDAMRAEEEFQLKRQKALADLEQTRAQTGKLSNDGAANNKAPAGYRWTADGNMEPIPGGPADAKAQALDAQKAAGATDVDSALATLRDAYGRLDEGGGITSTNKGTLNNMGAAISSSGVGQFIGKVVGTDNQSARNDIAMTRPALLAALMKATGMSAKQMDSNAELKLWMTTATDPGLDVESNRRALAAIERKYLGTGKPAMSATPSAPKMGMVQDGYVFIGGNPADPKSWKRAQ